MTTLGLIGAGHIGTQIARAAVTAGYDVVVSNAAGPASLADIVARLGPKARAATVEGAAEAGDLAVVAVPMAAFGSIPAAPLTGKVVVVTSNYTIDREGHVAALDDGTTTVPGLLQARLPGSFVVRAFSHISSADVTTDGRPPGDADRRALALAGDDDRARHTVAALYDAVGFDVLDLGGLAEAWRIDRGQPAFVARLSLVQLRAAVARADRSLSGR